jgi:hypothetical protein
MRERRGKHDAPIMCSFCVVCTKNVGILIG